MEKKNLIALLIVLALQSTSCHAYSCYECSDDYFTSQSFMLTRPINQNMLTKNASWHNLVHNRTEETPSAFQIIGLYQQSREWDKTARYFLFNDKTSLTVAGDNSPNFKDRDIRAEWLNLPSNFSGSFSINPTQHQMGVLFEFNQSLKGFFGSNFFDHSWISVSTPVIAVENNLNLKQFDLQNAVTRNDGPYDLLTAFNQSNWRYGKIIDKHSQLHLANIRLAFGSTYMSENNFEISYYSHLHINTAPLDPAHYLFDANVSGNGHNGMGAGLNFQIVLNDDNSCYNLCLFSNLEHTFFISHQQRRTLDLKNKPWSRYLLLNRKDREPDFNEPAINILTRKVKAHPYSMVDFTIGLRAKSKKIEIECGYGLWGHSDEKLELVCPFPEIYGIAGVTQTGDTQPRTASTSTINTQEATDTENTVGIDAGIFVPILEEDLCLSSGASRSTVNHRFHVAISSQPNGTKLNGIFGIGAFFEIAQRNSALKTWGLWGKIGAMF